MCVCVCVCVCVRACMCVTGPAKIDHLSTKNCWFLLSLLYHNLITIDITTIKSSSQLQNLMGFLLQLTEMRYFILNGRYLRKYNSVQFALTWSIFAGLSHIYTKYNIRTTIHSQFTTKHIHRLLGHYMTTACNHQTCLIKGLIGFGCCFGCLPPSCSTHPCYLEYT